MKPNTTHANMSNEELLNALLDGPAKVQQDMDIQLQRMEHVRQWGGSAHDDTHTGSQWAEYIGKQLHLMSRDFQAGLQGADYNDRMYRARMVKVAALAQDALAAYDRLHPDEQTDDARCGTCPACRLEAALRDVGEIPQVVKVRSLDELMDILLRGFKPRGR